MIWLGSIRLHKRVEGKGIKVVLLDTLILCLLKGLSTAQASSEYVRYLRLLLSLKFLRLFCLLCLGGHRINRGGKS